MAVIAAVNLVDRLVLLEDGRELPITQFYSATRGERPLTAKDELREEHRTDDAETAEVFTVDIPGTDAALIVEIAAIHTPTTSQIN